MGQLYPKTRMLMRISVYVIRTCEWSCEPLKYMSCMPQTLVWIFQIIPTAQIIQSRKCLHLGIHSIKLWPGYAIDFLLATKFTKHRYNFERINRKPLKIGLLKRNNRKYALRFDLLSNLSIPLLSNHESCTPWGLHTSGVVAIFLFHDSYSRSTRLINLQAKAITYVIGPCI